MIPALLAAPMVQGIVGGVVGSVMNAFSPTAPEPTTPTAAFTAQLQRAAATLQSTAISPTAGSMQSMQWNQMSPKDVQTFATSLSGRHVDASDIKGNTISGVVSGVQMTGNHITLNIGSHNVSLSDLKQISWSTSTV